MWKKAFEDTVLLVARNFFFSNIFFTLIEINSIIYIVVHKCFKSGIS